MYSPESVSNYFFGNPKAVADNILFVKRESRFPEYSRYLNDVEKFGNVWHGITGEYKGKQISVVATQIGPSMVGDCTYALNKPEAVCIYSGTCGGLASEMKIGDFFVPEKAVSADGFSQLFGRLFLSTVAGDEKLHRKVMDFFKNKNIHLHTGTVFSTSSVLAELQEAFWKMVPKDVKGIEMEGASFFTACSETQKRGAAVFWVTDLPTRRKSFFDPLSPDEAKEKQKIYQMIPLLELDIISSIHS